LTVADEVAAYLAERGVTCVFGIIGAGNMSLFDAIDRLGRTTVVCCHHEQAAVMAAAAYYRVSGVVTAALVTTGAGSSNALTGVLSAYMDSIPLVVLAGNEASTRRTIGRARGVQGYDSVAVAAPMTKRAHRVEFGHGRMSACLFDSFLTAECGRPGPIWIEIPMDVAASEAA
jgi:acetolactate synthase-1/2/3 large subunit